MTSKYKPGTTGWYNKVVFLKSEKQVEEFFRTVNNHRLRAIAAQARKQAGGSLSLEGQNLLDNPRQWL